MTNIRRALEAAAAVGGDATLYVEEVFSTCVYDGTGAAQSIATGVDLSDEGGLLWTKRRDSTSENGLFDSERSSFSKEISSNSTAAEYTGGNITISSTGFDVTGGAGETNPSGGEVVAWSFRKAPGFFDIVTYTGDGSNRTIAHNLGSVPGCIIIKDLTEAANWRVYHRANTAAPETEYLQLDGTNATADLAEAWNDTLPTSAVFSLGTNIDLNKNTNSYVAYLFAHDDQIFGADEDESIIKCGSYTTDGSGNATVSLGFEPQWVLNKVSSAADNWTIADNMRGFSVTNEQRLYANLTNAEAAATTFRPTSTGYTVNGGETSQTYIYIAIRRGPMKVPTAGTEVFAIDSRTTGNPNWDSNFVVDASLYNQDITGAYSRMLFSRLTGNSNVKTNSNMDKRAGGTDFAWDYMAGWGQDGSTAANSLTWMFKRAPEFMDVVCYVGGGLGTSPAHGLAVIPELKIIKNRTDTMDWVVGGSEISGVGGRADSLALNDDAATVVNATYWERADTATNFSVRQANGASDGSGKDYIAYLFATLAGVSKVGSYTADATLTTINCGFSAGARFILIKRTDATGDWYLYDSHRGIVAGNDPYLIANTDAAEVTGTDYIDPDNSGFQITAAGSSTINVDTGEYIFLAIA